MPRTIYTHTRVAHLGALIDGHWYAQLELARQAYQLDCSSPEFAKLSGQYTRHGQAIERLTVAVRKWEGTTR